jgi:two-component system alkaline phosphatase synthesis response regulator PhoP
MPQVMSRTILVVDDEPRIVDLARDYLEHAGFTVLTAPDGPTALAAARDKAPDLVVLDLGLPGLDGLDVTRQLRQGQSTAALPILMLTARDDELDKLLGLELGADDYLTKPFSPRELVARVKAVLRRADRPVGAGDVIRVGDLELDVPRMRTVAGGTSVELTPTEFTLLATLARCAPRHRVRELRTGDRLAHQEPAPQARARSTAATLRADRVRGRVSTGG